MELVGFVGFLSSSYLDYVFAFSVFHFQQWANGNLLSRQCLVHSRFTPYLLALCIPKTECVLQNCLGWTGLGLEKSANLADSTHVDLAQIGRPIKLTWKIYSWIGQQGPIIISFFLNGLSAFWNLALQLCW